MPRDIQVDNPFDVPCAEAILSTVFLVKARGVNDEDAAVTLVSLRVITFSKNHDNGRYLRPIEDIRG